MTGNNALSNRAQKALEVLEQGGQFCERLERDNYTGREQFKTRLVSKTGCILKGFGSSTKEELRNMLHICSSTSVSTYYSLRYIKKAEPVSIDW